MSNKTVNKMEEVVKIGEGDDAKEVEIYVVKPSNQILKEAEKVKAKKWNEAVQEGVLTKRELEAMLVDRGVWDKEKDKEQEKIVQKISELEKELYQGKKGHRKPKLSEGRKLAVDIRRERIKLRDLIAEKISMEENTADSMADNARFDYIVAHCTYYKKGDKPVYQGFDDYNSKSADEVAFAAATMLGRMLYSLDQDFEKRLPENEFLSKFSLVNDDLHLIDPKNPEYLIDTEGRRIDKDGYYLNEKGERVDKDGNLLTKDGKYIMQEFENDLI